MSKLFPTFTVLNVLSISEIALLSQTGNDECSIIIWGEMDGTILSHLSHCNNHFIQIHTVILLLSSDFWHHD